MFISFKLMFMLAIIDDVPYFTHFVFYPSLLTLENAIKIISIDNYCTQATVLCTRPKFQDRDQDQDRVVQDQDRDQDRVVQDQDRVVQDQDRVVQDQDKDRIVQDQDLSLKTINVILNCSIT